MTALFQRLLLGTIFTAGAALLLAGSWYCYTSTFDTGTVGLMSVNILHGERPLFYYGQPYFGALEAYLGAVFIYLFGFSEFVVSLSPITFTLAWILFSYLLFSRIHNRTAGLVAAACTAFPGYYVFWYTIATYGGYSVILCVGTAILWLSLRVLQERPGTLSLFLQGAAIGILMATGVWVHPLTFPYIIIGAGILGWFAIRERLRFQVLLPLGTALVLSLTGFLPFYFETGSFTGGISERVQLSGAIVIKALTNLFATNIHELVVWNFSHTLPTGFVRALALYGGLCVLAIGGVIALYSLVAVWDKSWRKRYYAIPLAFCLLFLALYVQHHMATIKAPRYAINFLIMLLCALWSLAIAGQKRKGLQTVSVILFCLWVAYQVTGTVLFIAGNNAHALEERTFARDIVRAAEEHNLKTVVTYGDPLFGMKAHKFSMYAENRIAFSHADAERYLGNAQLAETDLSRGYLTTSEYRTSLENTLRDLGVHFEEQQVHDYFLFTDLQPGTRYRMRAIPPGEIRNVDGKNRGNKDAWQFLLDRNQDAAPGLEDLAGSRLYLDTGRVRDLCGIWMFTSQDPAAPEWKRPGKIEVSVSEDGKEYNRVYTSPPQAGNGYYSGPSVYVGGPWGKVEILFKPVLGRYVKIALPEKGSPLVTELFLMETDGTLRGMGEDDIKAMAEIIRAENITSVLADRWVSARLRDLIPDNSSAGLTLPRHTTKYKNDRLQRFVRPAAGEAVVCDASVADECAKVLVRQFGERVIAKRHDLENYSLFTLADPGKGGDRSNCSALLWNGHFPLQTNDLDIIAPWCNAMGWPVWRADFTRTKGVYHDSWTNGKGRFCDLGYPVRKGENKEMVLVTHGWRPGADIKQLKLVVWINNSSALQFKEKLGNRYVFFLPDTLERLDCIEILSTTFIPPGPDKRKLGLDIDYIELQ